MRPPRFVRRIWKRLFARPEGPGRPYVRRGDDARSRQDWPAAAAAYRSAVEAEPDLVAIWIQLGHALKEQGDVAAAIEAYGEAARRQPDLAETHVFMAHLYKQLSRTEAAITHLLKGLHAGERASNESDELLRLLGHRVEKGRIGLIDLLRSVLEQLPPRPDEAPLVNQIRRIVTEDIAPADDSASPAEGPPPLVFDISDLISYYTHSRLPTGIQRVQIETIEGALARPGERAIRLCCFIDGRDEWLELPLQRMRAIARLSTAGGDRFEPEWIEAIDGLRLFLSLTPHFEFPYGASLINLGTSWWLQNYFLFVRQAKATRGIRYIPFVHDMIPIMAPEHCTRGLTQDFISWVIGVFDHADHFLVNSQATRRDLIKVAETLGHRLDVSDVAVIPLDADFRKSAATELPPRALDRWRLEAGRFVLFVSTIESRKGHLLAFNAWAELIARHGADAVPQLVCVGNRGWLNDQIYERLASDPVLAAKVTMLSRLSDEELALLYRSCLFTLYPSLYEGWGLPVTESLCYGKVPLVSDAASLPEAGGAFAVYVPAGSVPALTDAAERLIFDADHRAAAEASIAAGFRPRAWTDMAAQITDELGRFAQRDASAGGIVLPPTPTATIGAWHPLTRNESTRIWKGMRTGEGFRSDLGWYWPEARGCRVRREGGTMTIRLAGPHRRLRMMVELIGDEHGWSFWTLRAGETLLEGNLGLRQVGWQWFEIPAAEADHELTLEFAARPAGDGVVVTYFVRGFFLHAADDKAARQDLVEALALGRLDTLDAFGERAGGER
jgi:glycosyltransferase involved in cell wall biosynthesis